MTLLKRMVLQSSPQGYNLLTDLFLSYNARRRLKQDLIVRTLQEKHGLRVQSGPFEGMVFPPSTLSLLSATKLLGSYEAELHPAISDLLKGNFPSVINIGCGEGYYAVGLALGMPSTIVHAFDISYASRRLCKQVAEANGVSNRVMMAERCTTGRLDELTRGRALVVCDCEGCEMELLRLDAVPGLAHCDILVELHDFVDPSVSSTILKRFSATHNATVIDTAERDPARYPALRDFQPADQRQALDESRPGPMQWALLVAR